MTQDLVKQVSHEQQRLRTQYGNLSGKVAQQVDEVTDKLDRISSQLGGVLHEITSVGDELRQNFVDVTRPLTIMLGRLEAVLPGVMGLQRINVSALIRWRTAVKFTIFWNLIVVNLCSIRPVHMQHAFGLVVIDSTVGSLLDWIGMSEFTPICMLLVILFWNRGDSSSAQLNSTSR